MYAEIYGWYSLNVCKGFWVNTFNTIQNKGDTIQVKVWTLACGQKGY